MARKTQAPRPTAASAAPIKSTSRMSPEERRAYARFVDASLSVAARFDLMRISLNERATIRIGRAADLAAALEEQQSAVCAWLKASVKTATAKRAAK